MWNNRKEEYMFRKDQEKRIKEYRKLGMTDEQIRVMEEPEENAFIEKRKKERAGYEEIQLTVTDENGFEHEIDPMALSYEEDFCSDPFEYGFDDPRLNKIWANADETDRKILRLLGDGKKQSEIARALHLSEKAISKRVDKYRK